VLLPKLLFKSRKVMKDTDKRYEVLEHGVHSGECIERYFFKPVHRRLIACKPR